MFFRPADQIIYAFHPDDSCVLSRVFVTLSMNLRYFPTSGVAKSKDFQGSSLIYLKGYALGRLPFLAHECFGRLGASILARRHPGAGDHGSTYDLLLN